MMGKTHKVLAISTASLLGIFDLSLNSIMYIFTVFVTATLPDIDIYTKKHRQFTHSLLCLGILTLIAWGIYEPLGLCVLIGYGSHILADSFTKMGVAAFYPYKKMVGLKKITTGQSTDWFIFFSCLAYIYLRYFKHI